MQVSPSPCGCNCPLPFTSCQERHNIAGKSQRYSSSAFKHSDQADDYHLLQGVRRRPSTNVIIIVREDVKMHSLVFKRSELPKAMMKDKDSVESESGGGGGLGDVLFSKDDCQSCSLEQQASQYQSNFAAGPGMSLDSLIRQSVQIPHASNCSYGIQALINNVHRGYISEDRQDGGDRHHQDRVMITTEDQSSPWQESEILRQWKIKKEVELQERQRDSQAKQDHILEQAAVERENFYREREAQIEAKKRLNREREMKYHADVEAKQKLVEGNLWEAVAALIDLNGELADGKAAASGSAKSPKSVVELSTPRTHESKRSTRDYSPKSTKKTTDLSRMREVWT